MTEKSIAVIGVGYVGLPLAQALAGAHSDVIAFDTDTARVEGLSAGMDRNEPEEGGFEVPASLSFTTEVSDLAAASVYIVTVPTPIDGDQRPDLRPLQAACGTIGGVISKGDLVIFESTVYPGVTEEVCGPLISEHSGLKAGTDFTLGYSPERINPGDTVHTFATMMKIVAGQDAQTLDRVAAIYDPVVPAGLHRATSIKVAEAAKVTENIQRDLNIALMNELALIFERIGVRTADVIDAAATKWNFQRFTPGLVGGHCIGVDPYYLISRAEALGYYPEVIRAARRLNSSMSQHVAQRAVQMLVHLGNGVAGRKVGVLGVTFKEDVTDFRNSQVPEIIRQLHDFGLAPVAHDPHADVDRFREEYGIELRSWEDLVGVDVLVLAVPHHAFLGRPRDELFALARRPGVIIDVRSALNPAEVPEGINYWSL
ncbi:MAG: nucleotide sugar dehydrogenase [Rhodospirillaceae bacterium]|nr:nucleotide sugar dehydrogenase [Rhodospirillaceae bacterium]MBT6136074.1 nucleotide sugar dehydrogenase [Rhodospirillaceae bacterium]